MIAFRKGRAKITSLQGFFIQLVLRLETRSCIPTSTVFHVIEVVLKLRTIQNVRQVDAVKHFPVHRSSIGDINTRFEKQNENFPRSLLLL